MDYSEAFLKSELYRKYANQALSSFSASDVYTDLQAINACGVHELQAMDFLHRILQALQMNSSGYLAVADSAIATQASLQTISQRCNVAPTVSGGISDSTASFNARRRIGVKEITLDGSGEASNQELVAALSGYYGVIEMLGIWSDTADANTSFTFQDSDDAALTGGPAAFIVNIAASTVNTQLEGVVMHGANDNKALEVDITAGAASKVVVLLFRYWYET